MKREVLSELLNVIEDEPTRKSIIDKIMEENGNSINASKLKVDELTEQLGLKTKENDEANKLIEELKKSSKGNEELQAKFSEHESTIAQLKAENEQLKIDNAIKVALLGGKAKSDDLDYLMFKIKQEYKDLKLDDEGKIKGFDIADIKTAHPSNFEDESKKEVDVNNLPNVNDKDLSITKEEFDKMGYQARAQLYKDDPETYKALKEK